MNAIGLINKLSQVPPDTEVVGGVWNGKVDTYTVTGYGFERAL